MEKEKTPLAVAVADCFKDAEGVYPGEDIHVEVLDTGTRIVVYVSRMYEYLPLSFDVIKKLSEVFRTENFEVDKWSAAGCETCDYGSKYIHEFSFLKGLTA